jgi:hypothetical protein
LFPALADGPAENLAQFHHIWKRSLFYLSKTFSHNMINQNPQMKPWSSRVVVVDVDCVDELINE